MRPRHFGPLQLLESQAFLEQGFVLIVLETGLAADFALDAVTLIVADIGDTLLSPDHLAELDVFEDEVNLSEFWVIDDLQQGNHVGVAHFLEDGNLPHSLVLGRQSHDFSQTTLL